MAVRLLLFDFDGTLVDTLAAILVILNHLAEATGQAAITPEEVDHLRGLDSRTALELRGLSRLRRIVLLVLVRWQLSRQMSDLVAVAGMGEVLGELKARGYRLGIVTSNSRSNVRDFLKAVGWGRYFSFVVSSGRMFGKHRAIAQLTRRSHLLPEQVAYIGDETRDIEAARSAGVWSVSVGWGFNKPEILATRSPDALAHQPGDLLESIASLNPAVAGDRDP